MRAGDASAWPRWQPKFLPASDVMAAWSRAMKDAGSPGSPSAVRVYTHFAYCESSCDFCMYFHKVPTDESAYAGYADHLIARVNEFRDACGPVRANAAYFGGGTPSAMPPRELRRYLEAFRATFEVVGEFSCEAHPRSADRELIELLAEFGVNRISMGIQSLEPAVLRTITRRNRPLEHIVETVACARNAGMIANTDLCLGLPGQTLASFRNDVLTLLDVGADVITLYLYQPVSRLPNDPPPDMNYLQALDAAFIGVLGERGYRVGDAIDGGAVTVRLLRNEPTHHGFPEDHVYACFDQHPAHLIGFGPGSYNHIFGYGWFRDATSMGALGELPVYWGTKLTAVDEYRQRILDAAAQSSQFDRPRLDRATGVRGEEVFAEPLGLARSRGWLETVGDAEWFRSDADPAVKASVVDRLSLPLPSSASSDAAVPAHEPALVVLRSKNGRAPDAAPDLVRDFCAAIGIPARGHRFFGAVVRDVDETSLYFAVGTSHAVPLRLLVRKPGVARNLYETKRFAIAYAPRPETPLTDDEKGFLTFLARRMRLADAT